MTNLEAIVEELRRNWPGTTPGQVRDFLEAADRVAYRNEMTIANLLDDGLDLPAPP